MSTPNPMLLARQADQRRQTAQVDPDSKAKVVRPGRVKTEVTQIHDGVVKTKHLEEEGLIGQTVRAYLHGAPRGGERVIKSATKIEDGAMWLVEFESAHVDQEYKAAYRWYCEALDGAPVTRTVKTPAFVPYHEGA